MSKKNKILLPVLIACVLVATLLTFLYFFDLNRLKPLISETVKTYTGRDLTIQGDIRFTAFLPPGLTAEGVLLQNAPWGSQPDMVRVDRLAIAIDLKSLLKGEFRFFDIRAQGVEVLLEFDDKGVSNFLLDVPQTPGPAVMPSLAFRDIRIQGGRLVYIDRRWDGNLSMQVDHLVADIPGLDKPIRARGGGLVDGMPFSVEGGVGPIAHWVLPGYQQYFEVEARLGQTRIGLRGDIRDPIALKGTSLHITADGPSTRDIFALMQRKTLPDLGTFALQAALNDHGGPFALASLAVDAGTADQVAFSVDGSVANIEQLQGIDLRVGLKTTHAGHVAQLVGMQALPFDAPLATSATLTDTARRRFRLDDFSLTLGKTTVQGRMDLNLSGPHPMLDMALNSDDGPTAPMALSTRLKGSPQGIGIERFDLQLGTTRLAKAHVSGSAVSVYPLDGLDLTVHIYGDDLARVQQHFSRPVLVKGAFAMTAQILMADRHTVSLPEVKAILDRNSISGNLDVNLDSGPPVVKGVFTANQLNLQRLLAPDLLPPDVGKHLSVLDRSRVAFEVSNPFSRPGLSHFAAQTSIRDLASFDCSGAVRDLAGMQGVELSFSIAGSELSSLERLTGHDLFLQGPFALAGTIHDQGVSVYRIDDLDISVGDTTLKGLSTVDLSGKHPLFTIELAAERISTRAFPSGKRELLDKLKTRTDLGALSLTGDLLLSDRGPALRNLVLAAGNDDFVRVALNGSVGNLDGLGKIDLEFRCSGRDISVLKTFLDQPLPVQGDFAVSGRFFDHRPQRYMLSDLVLSLGPNRLTGWTHLNLSGPGPVVEAELTAEHFTFSTFTLAEIRPFQKIPDMGPLELAFKLSLADGSPSLNYLDFSMGAMETVSVMLQGSVGSLEPLGRIALDFDIASRDLSLLNRAYGTGLVDALPIHLAGRLEATHPGEIRLASLNAAYGDSDLSGTASMVISGDRPLLKGRFSSARLDLRPFIDKLGNRNKADLKGKDRAPSKERVFSRKPFDLKGLSSLDADFSLQAQSLLTRKFALDNVDIHLGLENGDVTVDPLRFDIGGGSAQGFMSLTTSPDIPVASMELTVSRFDLGPTLKQLDPQSTLEGSLNTDLQLTGRGGSVADLMASLNGSVYLNIQEGRIQSQQLALLERYLGSNVLDLINPFKQKISHTKINCLIGTTGITDGQTELKMVLDSEQTAIVVAGTIDLKKETLDIGIKPTPKKGFGEEHLGYISFSLKALSQPFALGGTLARPQLVLDPARTLITAGKFAGAFAFGPIGLAFFFSDISLGKKNICEEAAGALQVE